MWVQKVLFETVYCIQTVEDPSFKFMVFAVPGREPLDAFIWGFYQGVTLLKLF